jgi:beta-xylosidase
MTTGIVGVVLVLLLFMPTLLLALQIQSTYENPIDSDNCPDPGVIVTSSKNGAVTYFAATTTDFNSDPNKFPIRSSSNLVNWTLEGNLLLSFLKEKKKKQTHSIKPKKKKRIHLPPRTAAELGGDGLLGS